MQGPFLFKKVAKNGNCKISENQGNIHLSVRLFYVPINYNKAFLKNIDVQYLTWTKIHGIASFFKNISSLK